MAKPGVFSPVIRWHEAFLSKCSYILPHFPLTLRNWENGNCANISGGERRHRYRPQTYWSPFVCGPTGPASPRRPANMHSTCQHLSGKKFHLGWDLSTLPLQDAQNELLSYPGQKTGHFPSPWPVKSNLPDPRTFNRGPELGLWRSLNPHDYYAKVWSVCLCMHACTHVKNHKDNFHQIPTSMTCERLRILISIDEGKPKVSTLMRLKNNQNYLPQYRIRKSEDRRALDETPRFYS